MNTVRPETKIILFFNTLQWTNIASFLRQGFLTSLASRQLFLQMSWNNANFISEDNKDNPTLLNKNTVEQPIGD